MGTPIIKNGKRCKPLKTTTEEKIHQLRKQLGLNIRKEKRNETFRTNIRAVDIGRADWVKFA